MDDLTELLLIDARMCLPAFGLPTQLTQICAYSR